MATDPYKPVPGHFFDLPDDGGQGAMTDIVTPDQLSRYVREVKLIQLALGVDPDGIIGRKTREAARAVALSRK